MAPYGINEWSDTFSVRLGAETQPLADKPLRLRAGVLYDQSPIDDRHFDSLSLHAGSVAESMA